MANSTDCAQAVVDTVPLVMRNIRGELRSHRSTELSVPQFRILVHINNHPDASLSSAADHIGLTLPTISKMVDLLVSRQWVTRSESPQDRRRVRLALTTRGQDLLARAEETTRANLAKCFDGLPEDQLELIVQAMRTLHTVFSPGPDQRPTRL